MLIRHGLKSHSLPHLSLLQSPFQVEILASAGVRVGRDGGGEAGGRGGEVTSLYSTTKQGV